MRRLTVLLPILVLLGLLLGFVGERLGGPSDDMPSFTPAEAPHFEDFDRPGGGATLTGRVLSPAGEPVPDASVYLRSGGAPFWTYSDEAGRYELSGLADERSQAVVLAWGFPPTDFSVTPGAEDVDLVLPPRAPPPPSLPGVERADLGGKVRGTGSPWSDPAGYEIVFSPALPANVLQGPVERRVRSDPAGAFAIGDLALGKYRVKVLPRWARGGTWPDLGASWTAELEHVAESTLELELAAGAIEGRLWDASSQPVPVEGALVLVADAADPRRVWPPTATDDEGRFLIRALPAGHYALSARAGEGALEIDVLVRAGEVARPELPKLRTRAGS